jgi:serine/threonine protein kinase/Tfp pilus assembly protein PilF
MDPTDRPGAGEDRETPLIDAAREEALSRQTPETPRTPNDKRITQAVQTLAASFPRRIAHYNVTRVIASGGMGTVYEATQEHPRRTVAIKVLKRGVTSGRALRRFEYESQVLAGLQHPGIAHVYDAGWHEEGGQRAPYFALEYIASAKSIVEFADQRQLSIHARLRLFIDVCAAVHHGHQRGIIHRDIKPGNILVDASGQVKVIDFGVARSIDASVDPKTFETCYGEMVGTLKYMSPEQCQADPHDLDIRSDIYALGVVLFELLTGRFPYDLDSAPFAEAPRIICEQPPTRLSSVNRSLRGDLENIVHTALAKDRERRYQSALALADDIQRYLRDEPILARPPSAVYRLYKFVRRRPRSLAAAALLAILTAAGAVTEARAWSLGRERDRLAVSLELLEASVPMRDYANRPEEQARALRICNRAIELDGANGNAFALRAKLRQQAGDKRAAEADCKTALTLDAHNALALRTCAFANLEKGHFEAAAQQYELALASYALTWDLPRDFHNRGRVRRIAGRYETALEDHDRAVALAPDNGQPYKGRGVTRWMAGDIDGAINDLERAASLEGDRGAQCYLWIWEMRMLRNGPGDREAAEDALAAAESAAKSDRRVTGLIDVWRGRQAADDHLAGLARLGDPTDVPQAHYYLGAKSLVDGRTQEAAGHFERAADPVLHAFDEYDLARWHLTRLGAP